MVVVTGMLLAAVFSCSRKIQFSRKLSIMPYVSKVGFPSKKVGFPKFEITAIFMLNILETCCIMSLEAREKR